MDRSRRWRVRLRNHFQNVPLRRRQLLAGVIGTRPAHHSDDLPIVSQKGCATFHRGTCGKIDIFPKIFEMIELAISDARSSNRANVNARPEIVVVKQKKRELFADNTDQGDIPFGIFLHEPARKGTAVRKHDSDRRSILDQMAAGHNQPLGGN